MTHTDPDLRDQLLRALDFPLCRTLGYGTPEELLAAYDATRAVPATDQAGLRDRIRRAICEAEGFAWDSGTLEPDEYGEVADAVLAVLPTPTGQAAIRDATLAEAIAAVEDPEERAKTTTGLGLGWEAARDALRRLAGEAQQCAECGHPKAVHQPGDDPVTPGVCATCPDDDAHHDYKVRQDPTQNSTTQVRCSAATFGRPHGPHRWEPQPGMDPVRCPGACGCDHPATEHSVYGCEDGCVCAWMPKRKPMDPVHILGLYDDDARPGQPDTDSETPQDEVQP